MTLLKKLKVKFFVVKYCIVKVTVQLVREGKEMEIDLPDKATVKDLLKKIGYRVQGSVVVKDGLPIVEDERLNDGDKLQVFLAASGG